MTVNKQSKGGRARANALTPEQRSEIAKKAAQSRWGEKIPEAVKDGELSLGDAIIQCAVLPDETRVLSERAISKALGAKRGGSHWRRKKAGEVGANLPVFLSAKNISSSLSDELTEKLSAPVLYKSPGSKAIAHGIEASLLPDICVILMDLHERGKLLPSQIKIAIEAKALHRALAKVGIIALVDEVTGYQTIRDKQALQQILDKYFRKELAAWAKKFPDEFYKEMFRLKEWPWSNLTTKRPGVVGKYTNDLIYERLAPALLNELQKKNPIIKRGQRSVKHHQWLSEEVGDPALAQHIHAIIGLMRASNSWRQFKTLTDQAFPKKGQNLELFLDNPNE